MKKIACRRFMELRIRKVDSTGTITTVAIVTPSCAGRGCVGTTSGLCETLLPGDTDVYQGGDTLATIWDLTRSTSR